MARLVIARNERSWRKAGGAGVGDGAPFPRVLRRPVVALLLVLLAAVAGLARAQEVRPVESAGLVAKLYLPAGEGPHPGVLVLGGSGGGIGWQEDTAAVLAEHGFAALALAHFGMEGLPDGLELIPLEYFAKALAALAAEPAVDAARLGVVGVSKGGEAALLLASRTPEIRAVVAFVPSSHVFQSIADGWPRTSSWSDGGEPVPFVPYARVEFSNLAELYAASLEQAGELAAAAAIPVEEIQGPVLLLSGEADTLWPSAAMSEAVVKRLEGNAFSHEVVHVAYPDAGHGISNIRDGVAERLGGTEEGNRKAQLDARERMLAFLTRHLGAGTAADEAGAGPAPSGAGRPGAAPPGDSERFAPVAGLAGSCWAGVFPGTEARDVHCWEWALDGAFLRDRHEVTSPGGRYAGETFYGWDEAAGVLRFWYFNTLGGVSEGTVRHRDGVWLFDEEYRGGERELELRTSFEQPADDAYRVVIEQRTDSGWEERTRVDFRRAAPPR
jgi:hypothetical protein